MERRVLAGFSLILVLLFGLIVMVGSQEGGGLCEPQIWYTGASKFVLNEDCVITQSLYSGLIAYFNNTLGDYIPINTTITSVCSKQPLYDFCVEEGVYQAYFKADASTSQSVKYIYNNSDDYYSTYQPQSLNFRNNLDMIQQINMIQSVTGVPDGNKFTYPDAFGSGFNLTYIYWQDTILKKLIIDDFSSLPEPAQYIVDGNNVTLDMDYLFDYPGTLDVYINGTLWDKASRKTTKDRIDFRLDENTTLFYIPKPYAIDSDGNVTDLVMELKKGGSKIYIIVKTNYTWLSDTNITYPVIIDPTVTLQTADTENLNDTHTSNHNPFTNYGNDNDFYILDDKDSDYDNYAFIEFNTSAIPNNVNVLNVTLELYNRDNINNEQISTILVYELHNWEWDENIITNADKPSEIGELLNETCLVLDSEWQKMNVTTWVDYCYKYNNSCSFYLEVDAYHPTNGAGIEPNSKEYVADTSLRPILRVAYSYAPPNLLDNTTSPNDIDGEVNYHDYINISINSTDPNNNEVIEVNFTLTSENGTVLIDNVNGSLWYGDKWNSTTIQIYMNGTYTVNATTRNNFTIYNETSWKFYVEYYEPYIFNNRTASLGIQEPRARDNITIYINVTDYDSDAIYFVNQTLWYPNGTIVFTGNGTRNNDEWHSPISHVIKTNGTYDITINVSEATGLNISLENWDLNITYGTANVTSPDNKHKYGIAIKTGEHDTFNLSAWHTGNSPNKIKFNISANFTNTSGINTTLSINTTAEDNFIHSFHRMIQNDTTDTITMINVSVNSTSNIDGFRIGYVYWSRVDDDGVESYGSTELNISVSTDMADVDILTTTFAIAKIITESKTVVLSVNNTGNYQATLCNGVFANTLGATGSFNETDFTMDYGVSSVALLMTVSGGSVGNDVGASVSISCKATSAGGYDSDNIIGSIAITAPGGGDGGGGGGDAEPFCGDGACDILTENPIICPQDCFCGDGFCDERINNITMQPFETQQNCPEDCGEPAVFEETPAYVGEAWFLQPQEAFYNLSIFQILWFIGTAVVTYSVWRIYKRKKKLPARTKMLLIAVWVLTILFVWASFGAGTFQSVISGVQIPFQPAVDSVSSFVGGIQDSIISFFSLINQTATPNITQPIWGNIV